LIFNLLGREDKGIIALTFDSDKCKVIYKNNQMSSFESKNLQPMLVGEAYDMPVIFEMLRLDNMLIRSSM
jgi:hypothetical protein